MVDIQKQWDMAVVYIHSAETLLAISLPLEKREKRGQRHRTEARGPASLIAFS